MTPDTRTGALAEAIASTASALTGTSGKRAVSYLRVSSTAQAEKDYDSEGYSLPAQRDACARKARSLGANVVEVFIERGESGTSTRRRSALNAMLERVAEGDIDYVIVHKVDRLARRRADDSVIAEAIRSHGTKLVSVSENIDESPSGMLLHGIMASIAEFYSMNLAAEVMKGTTEKARRGGTPGRPRIGYLNVREIVDGREIRTIAVDPERGPLVTEAFTLYATGKYALSELAAIMEARGLRSRPRRGKPEAALGVNRLGSMLRSDYYIGIVRYAGKTSQGRHPKLIDEQTFQQVQELLDTRRKSGERCWRHQSYLRGTGYCGECKGRLIYTRAKGRGGTYEYFVCTGRQQGTCTQPHHRIQSVEQAIEDDYANNELTDARREEIRQAVRAYVASEDQHAQPERQQITETLIRLASEEKKLLQAHYEDHITPELFAAEQQRIRRERCAAEKRQSELQADYQEMLRTLETALSLTDHIQNAYILAEPGARRLFNQAIYERIEIICETIHATQLAPPFAQLQALPQDLTETPTNGNTDSAETPCDPDLEAWALQPRPRRAHAAHNKRTSTAYFNRGGSNVKALVRPSGLEPPRTVKSTRPSTLRVYQFRHGRRGASIAPAPGAAVAPPAGSCVRPLLALQCEHMFVAGHSPPERGAI